MSVRYLLPVHADLVGQALAIFGGFDRARQIAGLTAPPLDHDVDVVIGALRSLARSGVRLDATTLQTMGESSLVDACVDTCGSVAAAAARAGLGAAPAESQRRPSGYGQHQSGQHNQSGYRDRDRDRDRDRERERDRDRDGGHPSQQGFAQPPISSDGQVPTALALEVLQQTALQLGRVPAARDLPPDVARRLTNDYGSVRFAYLALRVHAEGQGVQQTAESAEKAASEPVAVVSREAFAATARLTDNVGIHRRNVEAAMAKAASLAAQASLDLAPLGDLTEDELADVWDEVEQKIDEAAAAAGEQLRRALHDALADFVDEVSDLARHATLAALVSPSGRVARAAPDQDDEDEDEEIEDEEDEHPADNGAAHVADANADANADADDPASEPEPALDRADPEPDAA